MELSLPSVYCHMYGTYERPLKSMRATTATATHIRGDAAARRRERMVGSSEGIEYRSTSKDILQMSLRSRSCSMIQQWMFKLWVRCCSWKEKMSRHQSSSLGECSVRKRRTIVVFHMMGEISPDWSPRRRRQRGGMKWDVARAQNIFYVLVQSG